MHHESLILHYLISVDSCPLVAKNFCSAVLVFLAEERKDYSSPPGSSLLPLGLWFVFLSHFLKETDHDSIKFFSPFDERQMSCPLNFNEP